MMPQWKCEWRMRRTPPTRAERGRQGWTSAVGTAPEPHGFSMGHSQSREWAKAPLLMSSPPPSGIPGSSLPPHGPCSLSATL